MAAPDPIVEDFDSEPSGCPKILNREPAVDGICGLWRGGSCSMLPLIDGDSGVLES